MEEDRGTARGTVRTCAGCSVPPRACSWMKALSRSRTQRAVTVSAVVRGAAARGGHSLQEGTLGWT